MTLMEMLVVIAIVSILLSVVFPAVGSGLGTLELRSAGTRLAAAARYARDQAVYRQATFQLEIDSPQGAIAVSDLSEATRRRYELPDSIHIEAVLPADVNAGGVRRFLFLPDGGAPAFEVVFSNGRREVVVTGDPLTGTASVEER